MKKLAIAIAAACVAVVVTVGLDWRERAESRGVAAATTAGPGRAARPPSATAALPPEPAPAPPRFTPVVRPDNDWDKEARQQLEAVDQDEARHLAALDDLGPRLGPPHIADTLRRWTVQAFALKRVIFANPVYSEADLALCYDRVRKLAAAQIKAEVSLLGQHGFNRWHHLRVAHASGIQVSDAEYAGTLKPRKPGTFVGTRHSWPVRQLDSRDYDPYFVR